jgi:CheY-like chemotaxis protein/HPt (histidine-containing phosphotransfer) domain-containing protein
VELLSSPPVADIVSVAETDQAPGTPVLGPAKVLVVEDGDTNRRLIRLILQRHGLEITEAANGQIGVNLAGEGDYDLILMDMQMPVKDGYTATAELRRNGLTTPIIALTAHAMSSDQGKCLAAGCTDYMTKPINEERLIRKLAEYISADLDHRPGSGVSNGSQESTDAIQSSLPLDDQDYREIVNEFIEQLEDRAGQMRAAANRGDLAELARLAHWLKGTGGSAGYEQFTIPAARLERHAKSGERLATATELDALERLVAQVMRGASLTVLAGAD